MDEHAFADIVGEGHLLLTEPAYPISIFLDPDMRLHCSLCGNFLEGMNGHWTANLLRHLDLHIKSFKDHGKDWESWRLFEGKCRIEGALGIKEFVPDGGESQGTHGGNVVPYTAFQPDPPANLAGEVIAKRSMIIRGY